MNEILCTNCKYFRHQDNVCSKFNIRRTNIGELRHGCYEEKDEQITGVSINARNIINKGIISSTGPKTQTKINIESHRDSGIIKSKGTGLNQKRKNHWYLNPWLITVVGGLIVVLISFYIFGIGDLNYKEKVETVKNSQELSDHEANVSYLYNNNLERITGFQIDTPINKLPDGIYGFTSALSVVYTVNDALDSDKEKINELKLDSTEIGSYKDFTFEIQKISNQEVYVIGYVNSENFSKIGDREFLKNTEIFLLPRIYADYQNLAAIPLQNIISIRDQDIEYKDDNFVKNITALVIKTDTIISRVQKHN